MRKRLVRYALVFLVLLLAFVFLPRAAPELPMSAEHHTENGFKNQYGEMPGKTLTKYLSMRLKTPHPNQQDYLHRVPVVDANEPAAGDKKVTWIGHSTLLLQNQGINVLTDPVFSKRASFSQLVGPARFFPPALKIDQLPQIHAVVISHNHYDHMDADSIKQLSQRADPPLWIVPLENARHLRGFGVPEKQIVELDWWQSHSTAADNKLTVTATPSQHWSKRSAWDTNYSLWAAFAIDIAGWKLWFGGDTGYNDKTFVEIGERLGPFDVGLIPIGAYDPEWFMGYGHVNPAEALQIHQDIAAKQSLAIHWGTFQLTAEPVYEPPLRLAKALEQQQLPAATFTTMAIGESREF